jgi:hypothetical protein
MRSHKIPHLHVFTNSIFEFYNDALVYRLNKEKRQINTIVDLPFCRNDIFKYIFINRLRLFFLLFPLLDNFLDDLIDLTSRLVHGIAKNSVNGCIIHIDKSAFGCVSNDIVFVS